jgi:cell wall-associated NlpC family hydrolase
MDFAACIVPAAPVRKKSSHKAEMVNQLLFGEMMRVIDAKKNWWKIQTVHDNYEGWIRNNLVTLIPEELPDNSFVAGELINTIDINENKMLISFGSSLPAFNNGKGSIAGSSFSFNGYAVNRTLVTSDEKTVRQLTSQWFNAPYLWGGRTPLGVDCSGFAQVIFKMMGLDLLRDAKQQVGQGMKVKKLEDAQCGDLAFFEKKNKITHVGILLNPNEIIHASGKVRIDKIDKKGIINTDTEKRTHSLAAIRRYW